MNRRDISRLAYRLSVERGGAVPEATVEHDYALAAFLVGFAQSDLSEDLAFKGGTALKHCYIGEYRFSEDLDFTLVGSVPGDSIPERFASTFEDIHAAAGVTYGLAAKPVVEHRNGLSFYLEYESVAGTTRATNSVKVDVTTEERVVYPLESKPILRPYPEYAELPSDARVQVYSVAEIAAEKIVALFDPARQQPRDLFDLWYLFENGYVMADELVEAVEMKLKLRKRTLEMCQGALEKKYANYQKAWEVRLRHQMVTLPEFEATYRSVQRTLRQANLSNRAAKGL